MDRFSFSTSFSRFPSGSSTVMECNIVTCLVFIFARYICRLTLYPGLSSYFFTVNAMLFTTSCAPLYTRPNVHPKGSHTHLGRISHHRSSTTITRVCSGTPVKMLCLISDLSRFTHHSPTIYRNASLPRPQTATSDDERRGRSLQGRTR